MIRAARQGKRVVRLKGGDPFVFGRGAEEALALAQAGIPFEVVPGVTTAVAAPELAGIPVTHRGVASAFLVVAGHTAEALDGALAAVRPNSRHGGGDDGAGRPRRRGRTPDRARLGGETPAAIVCGASTPDAWTWTGRLDELAAADAAARRWPACWSLAKSWKSRALAGGGRRPRGGSRRTRAR